MMAKVISGSENPVYAAAKPKTPISSPNISYAKPLYYISLLTAMTCPINMDKYEAKSCRGYKLYTCFMITVILVANGFSCRGRLSSTYTFLLQTVVITDVIQQVVLLLSNIYGIVNVLSCGEKYIKSYFQMLKQIDKNLLTTMNLRRKTIVFYTQLFFSHLLLILLFTYDYWTWASLLGVNIWIYYAFRLYSYYLNMVIVMQVYTFSSALQIRFKIFNQRLFDVCIEWIGSLQSHQSVAIRDLYFSYMKSASPVDTNGLSLNCLVRMHDLLCDVIQLLNEAFGFNIVMLVCNIIVNSVIAFNLTLIFGTGYQPADGPYYGHLIALNVFWALLFMSMGVAVAKSCDAAAKEARKTATICYKILGCIPVCPCSPKDEETRILLNQLAMQIEHRKPEFDACGFFPVNHSMLYAIIGAISSYIVIIIQFNNTPVLGNTGNFTGTLNKQ